MPSIFSAGDAGNRAINDLSHRGHRLLERDPRSPTLPPSYRRPRRTQDLNSSFTPPQAVTDAPFFFYLTNIINKKGTSKPQHTLTLLPQETSASSSYARDWSSKFPSLS